MPTLSLSSSLEMDGGVLKLCGLKPPPLSVPTADPKPQHGHRAGGDEPCGHSTRCQPCPQDGASPADSAVVAGGGGTMLTILFLSSPADATVA